MSNHAAQGSTVSCPDTNGEGRVRPPGAALFMHTGETAEAKQLVERFHYTGRWVGGVRLCCTWHEAGGLFGDSGPAIAACVFTTPPPAWREPVWELARLVRTELSECSLSGLIAAAMQFIQKTQQQDLVISYADWTQGHHGGIYQAASWNYAGKRARSRDGMVVSGTFVPNWTVTDRFGTKSLGKLRDQGLDVEPHFDEGKHLYWRALSRSGYRKARRLGLEALPYPKPGDAA